MMRCVYCLNDLETDPIGEKVLACRHCGLRYSAELFSDLDTERVLTDPRYEVERHPGPPPSVTITDVAPGRLVPYLLAEMLDGEDDETRAFLVGQIRAHNYVITRPEPGFLVFDVGPDDDPRSRALITPDDPDVHLEAMLEALEDPPG